MEWAIIITITAVIAIIIVIITPKLCYSEMGKCFLFQTADFPPGWLQGWEQAARRGRELLGATGCCWVLLGGTGCFWGGAGGCCCLGSQGWQENCPLLSLQNAAWQWLSARRGIEVPVINLGCSDNQLVRAEKRVTCRIRRAAVREVLAEGWLPKPEQDGTGP